MPAFDVTDDDTDVHAFARKLMQVLDIGHSRRLE